MCASDVYDGAVKPLGQFCSISRSLDVFGERWSLLIVREVLMGSRRFGDIRRGVPRISRTMLAARLRELVDAGVLTRVEDDGAPTYELTEAGRELETVIRSLGIWGQRWLPRTLSDDDLDVDALVWDLRRRVSLDTLPSSPVVVRIELSDDHRRVHRRFLLLRRSEVVPVAVPALRVRRRRPRATSRLTAGTNYVLHDAWAWP